MTFGPWVPGVDPSERLARLRAMRAIGLTLARRFPDLLDALERAEREPAALPVALELLERLPALNKRRMLGTYCDLGRAR